MHFNAKSVLGALFLLAASVSADGESVPNTELVPRDLSEDTYSVLEARADSPTMTNDAYFRQYILAGHNFFRGQHGAPALTWNADRAVIAQDWANNCVFKHSPTKLAGENIAIGYRNVPDTVNAWGTERTRYNFASPGFTEATGHFTQVVWKSTTQVGCGRKKCGTRGWLVVCQYTPPGNYAGQFGGNVLKQTRGAITDRYIAQPISAKAKRFES